MADKDEDKKDEDKKDEDKKDEDKKDEGKDKKIEESPLSQFDLENYSLQFPNGFWGNKELPFVQRTSTYANTTMVIGLPSLLKFNNQELWKTLMIAQESNLKKSELLEKSLSTT
jgi:hypothetical protein